ncbi:restriction endonuclease subunit S [Xanthomonas nasturtii]|uniref:restriction endonuclease subunit S n=1 Tax=Xanthomonas nasturtii TaxID=1843581 RepID=UPI0007E2E4B9|nr:restriction endonuclease subunit S [Xanthomonas nasturtii]MCL1498471.1 restriction endonuclease subunit S [Xanthomonas nasturtii]MCL1502045.1 restriction endonuclease subunit S [Xanthomonas nasturtii]MCL1521679.1 restriction endonuclease subunit S [Xanthomonas nasturtii]OAX86884.1 restriction endonuclease subunit S [Xanthomonas nasturtii]WVL55680.1 restriction endonuclease subunit S [Xanthomonas nasturtii]
MLPEGWSRRPLHEVADVRTGVAKGKTGLTDPVELPYLRVANVQDGFIDLSEVKTIAVERHQIDRYSLQAGDILMTEGGDFDKLGRGAVWSGTIDPCLHQNHVFAVRAKRELVNPLFLSALSGSEYGRTYFLGCAKRSTNLASINSSQLKAFPVLLPPVAEQNQIAHILSTWDQAIATTEQLLANAIRHRKVLINQLFIHGRHSDMTTHRWRFTDFDEIFDRVTRRNAIGNSNVLTISGTRGLVSQRDYFKKSVASENLSGYTLLERGEFAYNKSYSTGYPMGAIKPLTRYDQGVVSSLYICFRFRDGTEADADADFFRHYFEEGMLNEGLSGIAQEGARNHGLLNVGVGDFFKLRLHIPDVTEQRRIAAVLNIAEQKEKLIAAQLHKLRDEKKALMAQLLTGKRRVRLPAGEASTA